MAPSIPTFLPTLSPAFHFISNLFLITILFLSFGSPVESQITSSQNFLPFSYPLAVRSPYFNTWQNTPNTATSLTQDWPKHWSDQINGWSGFVRIDGVTWKWLGNSPIGNATTLRSTAITPTTTTFTISAGNMTLTIKFLSPIETDDLTKQSMPFSYVTFECQSQDGAAHDVQVHSDISAEWISGDRNNEATWGTALTGSSIIHSASRESPQPMTENGNIAEDAKVYYAMAKRDGMSYQSGTDNDVRGTFRDKGGLLNTSDTNFRPINQNFIVFGISVDLGTITSTSEPVVWGLGLVRDPITTYPSASGSSLNSYRPYFFSDPQFANKQVEDVIDSFLQDYDNAAQRADALDKRILTDASAASPGESQQYYNLLAMAARQAVAVDLTFASVEQDGENRTDIKAFMRNTGADTTVNSVSTLYSSFPAFLYLNATWGGYLLDSLLEYQNSSAYTNAYAAEGLGFNYPKAPGDNSDTSQFGVEDTASMLMMVLAHARTSGDGTLIGKYYKLLKGWADFLVQNALHPQNQVSSDNVGPKVTDSSKLAMKGIIGIGAMAQMSRAFGNSQDEGFYSANASTMALQWKSLALASNKITATYGDSSSSALMYDLYSDLLLGTGLFDQDVYNAQVAMIKSASHGSFGIPIDSNSGTNTRSPRLMFVAGSLSKTDNSTRNQVIDDVLARAAFGDPKAGGNFPTSYDINDGTMSNSQSAGQASPAHGAMFALLALGMPNQTINVLSSLSGSSDSSSSKVNAGAIAGGVIGGLAGLAILAMAAVFFTRWRRRRADQQRMLVEPRQSHRFSMGRPFFGNSGTSQPSSFNPYNNYSQSGEANSSYDMQQMQAGGSRILPPEDGVYGNNSGYGSGFVGAGYAETQSGSGSGSGSGGSSEKRRFAPNRGTNWDTMAAQNQSNIHSDGTGPTSPTFSQSANSAAGRSVVSSRYQQSQRSDTTQLRQEVEGLRREMEELRAQARDYEPPPSYH
ncbi:hypothetical protein VKT23_008542 [Stygiomarasmius scandens]|uniref:DUF1793-domain-containing protein n=1 Tax=Marasmiellus scandens TaxID=2682957 RepID=A0ABR1JLD8_9AGAR